jgi:hypothetical protein
MKDESQQQVPPDKMFWKNKYSGVHMSDHDYGFLSQAEKDQMVPADRLVRGIFGDDPFKDKLPPSSLDRSGSQPGKERHFYEIIRGSIDPEVNGDYMGSCNWGQSYHVKNFSDGKWYSTNPVTHWLKHTPQPPLTEQGKEEEIAEIYKRWDKHSEHSRKVIDDKNDEITKLEAELAALKSKPTDGEIENLKVQLHDYEEMLYRVACGTAMHQSAKKILEKYGKKV